MIVELYQYLTNPATPSAKKLGQLKETIAMEARYRRSKKQWDSHLTNSKNIIKEAASTVDKKNDAIILGSGLLLDIPISYLSKQFNHVFLIDVVHLKKAKKAIKKYSNVSLVEHDVTGLAEKMLDSNFKKENFDTIHKATIPCLTPNTGLVVSANMLSQIHLAPVYYAESHYGLTQTELEKLARNIQLQHITMLNDAPCKVCLLTDYKRIYRDENDNKINIDDVLINIKLPEPNKKWHWEIAPKGEIDRDSSMTSLVYAYCDFQNKQVIL